MNILSKDSAYVLHTYRRLPIEIKKAQGSYLYDVNGKKYLDMMAGIAVNSVGHVHPKVKRAIHQQLRKHMHLSNYFVSDIQNALAKILIEHSASSKVFFTNSGTEAIEASLKLARKYGKTIHPDKIEVVALKDAFHGRTLGGLSLTGQPKYQDAFQPLIPGIRHIGRNDIDALKEAVSDKTCAVFVELIQGESGIHALEKPFLEALSELRDQHQFLIVADEVQTGLMRTGKMFAYQHTSLVPDVIALAKSLGGGLPLGAMLVTKRLENIFSPGDHGTTFGGNPVSCAAGFATLSIVTSSGFQNDLISKSNHLFQRLNDLKAKYPIIREIRGKGLMIGIEVDGDAERIKANALSKGLILNVTNKNVIRLLPPLSISMKEIGYFLRIFEVSLQT